MNRSEIDRCFNVVGRQLLYEPEKDLDLMLVAEQVKGVTKK